MEALLVEALLVEALLVEALLETQPVGRSRKAAAAPEHAELAALPMARQPQSATGSLREGDCPMATSLGGEPTAIGPLPLLARDSIFAIG